MARTTKSMALLIVLLTVPVVFQAVMLASIDNSTQPSHIRVACIGDSITRGTQYTLDLWALLGPNYIVGDFCVGGAAVSLKSANEYMNKTEFNVLKAFSQTSLLLCWG
jgi:hypothetical protein